jgi:hypothetical protein
MYYKHFEFKPNCHRVADICRITVSKNANPWVVRLVANVASKYSR